MIQYHQNSTLHLALPSVFGDNEFFTVHTLRRPLQKPKRFSLRVFSSHIAATPEGAGFIAVPKPDPLVFFEAEDNLLQRALTIDAHGADTEVDVERPVYLTIPHFFQSIYGHWLVDILPALWVAARLLSMMKVELLYAGTLPPFAPALLDTLGLPRTTLVDVATLDATRPHQLVILSPLREHDYFFRHLLRHNMVDAVRKVVGHTRSATERLYVSRREWRPMTPDSRALVNRDEVEALFVRRGYTLVFPEKLTLHEQRELFARAAVITGESGSGLHNSIFMPATGHTLCVQSGRQTHLIQASLCDLFGQSSSYVIGRQENADWNANFHASLADVERAIGSAT